MSDHQGIDDLLPEGAIPIASIRGVIYMDAQGAERYACQWGHDCSIPITAGLIRIVEHQFLNDCLAREDP